MPIFEFTCRKCGNVFAKLVLSRMHGKPECPECSSDGVEQILSAFATAGTSAKNSSSHAPCAPAGGG